MPIAQGRRHFIFTTLFMLLFSSIASGADWPMWRYDAGRSAAPADTAPSERRVLRRMQSVWSFVYVQRQVSSGIRLELQSLAATVEIDNRSLV